MRFAGRWLAVAASLVVITTIASASERDFDRDHSSAEFTVRVLWLHTVRGRIGEVRGRVTLSADRRARVDAWIDVATVQMDNPRYLATVRSPDFFDAADYPEMHFRSQTFDAAELARGGSLPGHLTLRGVTRKVEFELLPSHCSEPARGPCSIRVRGAVRRSDFGMDSHRFSVADRVALRLAVTLAPVADR